MLKVLRPLAVALAAAGLLGCGDLATGVDTALFQGCRVTAYQIGTVVTGTLSASDCRLVVNGQQRAEYVDYYAFNLPTPRTVTFDLTSNQLDPYLYLWSRNGQLMAQDDHGGTGVNARITISLPAGDYVVGATSYWEEETGSYNLSSD